jgi:hypothetical protein
MRVISDLYHTTKGVKRTLARAVSGSYPQFYPHDIHHIHFYAQVIHMTYLTFLNVRFVILTHE